MVDVLVEALQIAHAENINDKLVDGFISYLAYAKEVSELEPLLNKIKHNIPFYEDKVMSYAEELIQRGRQEAMSYARQEMAIEMLRDANSLDKVVKYTHLSLEEVKDLQKKIFTL